MAGVPPPTIVPLCPECGVKQDEARKGARKFQRAGFWFPVVCTLVAGLIIASMTLGTVSSDSPWSDWELPRAVDPLVSLDQLRRFTRGESIPALDGDPGCLVRCLQQRSGEGSPHIPGRVMLLAAFTGLTGARQEVTTAGWPGTVYWTERYTSTHDPHHPFPMITAPAMPPQWSFSPQAVSRLAQGPPADRVTRGLSLEGVGLWIAMVVLVAYASSGLARSIKLAAPLLRLWSWSIPFMVALACAAMTALTAERDVGHYPFGVLSFLPTQRVTDDQGRLIGVEGMGSGAVTQLDRSAVLALPPTADGDRRVARAIVEAASPSVSDSDSAFGLVAVLFVEETVAERSFSVVGYPWNWLICWTTTRSWQLPGGATAAALYPPRRPMWTGNAAC